MAEVRIAVLSDVHGNRWALDAVLEDVARRDVRTIVNLGDSLYGPLDPGGTAEVLTGLDAPTVRGNEDRIIVDKSNRPRVSPVLEFVRRTLEPEHVRWLEGLPMALTLDESLFLCHGTPERDDEYLLRSVVEKRIVPRSPQRLADLLGSVSTPVVLCGHDHLPGTVRAPGGRLIVNPGSVGCPAFTDDFPSPHAVEAGSPQARYAVVSRAGGKWTVEDVALDYDWESAARAAERNGRSDWAMWLRTGRAVRRGTGRQRIDNGK